MIKYEIISTDTSLLKTDNRTRNRLTPGEPGFKDEVFNRVLNGCKHIQEGDYVKIRRTPKKGTVVKKHLTVDTVQWDNNRPLILEIVIEGQQYAVHPSQLKKVNSLK